MTYTMSLLYPRFLLIHTYMHILHLSSKFSVAVELISSRKKKLKRNKNMLSYNFNIIYKLYKTES